MNDRTDEPAHVRERERLKAQRRAGRMPAIASRRAPADARVIAPRPAGRDPDHGCVDWYEYDGTGN
jgi:hypothetical protein